MTDEWQSEQNFEEGSQGTIPHLPGGTVENHMHLKEERPRFELGMPQIQV